MATEGRNVCKELTGKNLKEFMMTETFLKLELHDLLALIESDSITAENKEVMPEAVVRWVEFIGNERSDSFVNAVLKGHSRSRNNEQEEVFPVAGGSNIKRPISNITKDKEDAEDSSDEDTNASKKQRLN